MPAIKASRNFKIGEDVVCMQPIEGLTLYQRYKVHNAYIIAETLQEFVDLTNDNGHICSYQTWRFVTKPTIDQTYGREYEEIMASQIALDQALDPPYNGEVHSQTNPKL